MQEIYCNTICKIMIIVFFLLMCMTAVMKTEPFVSDLSIYPDRYINFLCSAVINCGQGLDLVKYYYQSYNQMQIYMYEINLIFFWTNHQDIKLFHYFIFYHVPLCFVLSYFLFFKLRFASMQMSAFSLSARTPPFSTNNIFVCFQG